MKDKLLDQLKAIDQTILTDIVCKDQGCSDLEIVDWKVEPLSHQKVITTTGGLFRFSGLARNKQEQLPWTVILKCINNPKPRKQEPGGWSYWRREAEVFKSEFLGQLPSGVRAPLFYGAIEKDDGVWLWLEYILEATGRKWSLSDFQRTAKQLGYFQGGFLSGNLPVDWPWLSQSFFRNIWTDNENWSNIMNPEVEWSAWNLPIVQQRFDTQQKGRILQLLADRQYFFAANDKLPQVLCHNDAHRRNFIWTQSKQTGEAELVGIDWALTGSGALGNDLGELIGTSIYWFEYDPYQAEALEEAVFEGYLAGIAARNLEVDKRLIRLGYLISLSFWMGAMIPGWIKILMSPDSKADVQAMFGYPAADVQAGWVQLNDFCLDRADEARRLIQQLYL